MLEKAWIALKRLLSRNIEVKGSSGEGSERKEKSYNKSCCSLGYTHIMNRMLVDRNIKGAFDEGSDENEHVTGHWREGNLVQ